jgi:tetratricopeptide (TPR) repeat protein
MLVTLALEDGCMRLRVRTPYFTETRAFDSTDTDRLRALAKRYDQTVAASTDADLLGIGRDLALWLTGESRWLERLLDCEPPLQLEIRVPRHFGEADRVLLDAPWELLADHRGFFVADRHIRLAPHRRIAGEPKPFGPQPGALTVLFMAASPRGVPELDFEAEEAQILAATKGLPLDLFVEETGTAHELGLRTAQLATPEHAVHVVHVSCHGEHLPKPAMLLEDESGDPALATAEDLYKSLGGAGSSVGLVFLSACSTAATSPVRPTDSLTLDLVRSGVRAVLGWAAPVGDWTASCFATVLYATLARGDTSLEVSVGEARRELLVAKSGPSPYWHLSRLILGSTGGDLLCLPNGQRRKQGPIHKHFLGNDRRIPVAGPAEFVGRRRTLQTCIRALRDHEKIGLLLHGTGGLGKSSVAARVVDRMSSHETVVLHGSFSHGELIEKVAAAVGSATKSWRDEWWAKERETGDALRELLEMPLVKPLLLVLDDFEQLLDARPDALHVVKADAVDLVRGIVHAFVHGSGSSRLLITSRFDFALVDRVGEDLPGKLVRVSVPSFSEREEDKRLRREAGDLELLLRCGRSSYGNPALLSLLLERAQQEPVGCEALLDQVEGRTEITDEGLRSRLQYLAVERVIEALNQSEHELLRLSLHFAVPVPLELVPLLGEGDGSRLVSLGVWDVFPDVADEARQAIMPNRMVAEWSCRADLKAPSKARRDTLARALARELCRAWASIRGHTRDDACLRAGSWLAELAHGVGDDEVFAVFARLAVAWRAKTSSVEDLRAFSRHVVEQLRDTGRLDDAVLLVEVARMHQTAEDGNFWIWCLERAVECSGPLSPGNRAAVLRDLAAAKERQGKLDEALTHLERCILLLEEIRDLRSRVVTLGAVANILETRGDLDEALRIRQEEQLPFFEALGNDRERALTLRGIADILQVQGDFDEALHIYRDEVLPVLERLGDLREWAGTLSKVADILQVRGSLEEALRIRIDQEIPAYERVADVPSRAIAMGKIAEILQERGDLDGAARLQQELLLVADRSGNVHLRAECLVRVADNLRLRSDLDGALLILQREVLPVFESQGDIRSRAIAWGRIAGIQEARGNLDEALRISLEEELPVYEQLRAVQLRALTLGRIADIEQARGNFDEAIRIRRDQELPIYERVGDVRSLVRGRVNLALNFDARGCWDDNLEFEALISMALQDARRFQLPDVEGIESLIRRFGGDPDAWPFSGGPPSLPIGRFPNQLDC